MSNPFDGAKAVWVHQSDQLGERTYADLAATLKSYAGGTSIVLQKAMDQGAWMGAFDHGPLAVTSATRWGALQQQAQLAGLTLLPWVVPAHYSDAIFHAQLGPALVIDLEPYAGFWQDSAANAALYLAGLRISGVQQVYVSIDPRPQAMAALGIADWGGRVDGLLPQVYWTDFQRPAMESVPYLQACLKLNPNVWPALPYNADPTDLATFWQAAQSAGCRGASLWRLGSANAAQLRAFGALPMPTQPTPDPRDAQIKALTATVATLTTERDRLKGIVAAVRTAVAG